MTSLRLLSLLPVIFLLVSCIDGDEEIWLRRDGSGRIEASYKMPGAIMQRFGSAPILQEKFERAIAREPTIRATHIGHHLESGRVVFTFAADFDDIRTLAAFPKTHLRSPSAPGTPTPEEALFGKMDLRVKGLTLSFDRQVDLSPILPDSARQNPGMLGEARFRYTVHLPATASTHNATGVLDEGRTLTWTFPLRDHTNKPMVLTLMAPLPIPWWVWVLGVPVVALILLFLIRAALLGRSRGDQTMSAQANT